MFSTLACSSEQRSLGSMASGPRDDGRWSVDTCPLQEPPQFRIFMNSHLSLGVHKRDYIFVLKHIGVSLFSSNLTMMDNSKSPHTQPCVHIPREKLSECTYVFNSERRPAIKMPRMMSRIASSALLWTYTEHPPVHHICHLTCSHSLF